MLVGEGDVIWEVIFVVGEGEFVLELESFSGGK